MVVDCCTEHIGLTIGLDGDIWEDHTIAFWLKNQLVHHRATQGQARNKKFQTTGRMVTHTHVVEDAEWKYATRFLTTPVEEDQALQHAPWLLPDQQPYSRTLSGSSCSSDIESEEGNSSESELDWKMVEKRRLKRIVKSYTSMLNRPRCSMPRTPTSSSSPRRHA